MADPTIKCPQCGHEVPVTRALTQQIEESLREEFKLESRVREEELSASFAEKIELETTKAKEEATEAANRLASQELEDVNEQLAEAKQKEETLRANFDAAVKSELAGLQEKAKLEAEGAVVDKMNRLRKTSTERGRRIKALEGQADELKIREQAVELKETKIDAKIKQAVERAQREAHNQSSKQFASEIRDLKLEHNKVVVDLQHKLTEANVRLDQRSQQLKGEIIENEFERILAKTCPEDEIEPVKKGKRGADIIQRVISPSGHHCGTIIWETKNTKNWAKTWITKLRSDQRRMKADVAVLVSKAMPKDFDSNLGQIQGIWVADYSVVAGLALALRQNLIELYRLLRSAEAKEEMEVLYNYLISKDFRHRVEAMVDAFRGMREDLEKEKASTERSWAKRERQISQVTRNVAGMIGDIQAIMPAFPPIKRLELPPPD